jgi:hypothetical protein
MAVEEALLRGLACLLGIWLAAWSIPVASSCARRIGRPDADDRGGFRVPGEIGASPQLRLRLFTAGFMLLAVVGLVSAGAAWGISLPGGLRLGPAPMAAVGIGLFAAGWGIWRLARASDYVVSIARGRGSWFSEVDTLRALLDPADGAEDWDDYICEFTGKGAAAMHSLTLAGGLALTIWGIAAWSAVR